MAAEYSKDKKYYHDVLHNLLFCQDGLCAYTEKRIIAGEEIEEIANAFAGGRNTMEKPEISVNIDHFDSDLKDKQGWDWNNLFAVDPRVNMEVKRVMEPIARTRFDFEEYMFLKPDSESYSPFKFLEYDSKEHIFFPSSEIDDDVAEKVDIVLDFLGINYGTVKRERGQYLDDQILLNHQPDQYLTAYQMMMQNQKNPKP